MTRRTPPPPRAPSPPDWYAVGRALRAEVGALPPAAAAALVRERWPAIGDADLLALGIGYACGDGSRGRGGAIG